MKKIMFITYFYHPDISAGVFRIKSLVDYIVNNSNYEIHIYTTKPNRFIDKKVEEELSNNRLKVYRVGVPFQNKSNFFQLLNFIYFCLFVILKSINKKYDLIFSTTSKLGSGFLGSFISKLKSIKLYLDIRDIFIDTLESLYPGYKFLIYPLSLVEKFTLCQATHINLVSEGFKSYFKIKYNLNNFSFNTNGIDFEYTKLNNIESNSCENSIKEILYIGNIGQGQDLHNIIPFLLQNIKNIKFTIIGSGNKKNILISELHRKNLTNYQILNPIPRNELIKFYKKADILFLNLAKKKAFERALPSKIFEYSVFDKPIFAGVTGYCSQFLNANIKGAYVFETENYEMALEKFKEIKFEKIDRLDFIKKYSRRSINIVIKKEIESIIGI